MTRRFHVRPGTLDGAAIALEGPLAHRLVKVLRITVGDEVILFDGSGEDVRVRIGRATDRRIEATVIDRSAGPAEPRTSVHLYQSITKGERFEWLVEKATELGVHRIVPLIAARAVVKTAGEGNRMDRWQRIAVEAAEQCERSVVPTIGAPEPLAAALTGAPGLLLLPYEDAHHTATGIQQALDSRVDDLFAAAAVSIFIGPEGGYEPAEVDAAQTAGATVVTLGDRVLRSETAGIVALTLVMHATGQLG